MKQLRRLTQLLIISGSLNVAQALYFVWTIKDKPIITSLKPVKLREQLPPLVDHRTSAQVIHEFKSMPLEQLLPKLHNNHLVENGLLQSDLALACLVSFHHFDLVRALSGQMQLMQKCDISFDFSNPGQKITVYPGLTVEQYQSILAFAQKERWPLTAEGIFLIWQGKLNRDRTLEEAFYLTQEFLAVETLFRRTDAMMERQELFQMIMQGDWQILKQFTDQQKFSQDLSSARRQRLLLDYLAKGSKTAASILLKTDGTFASKKLDDSTTLSILKLLDQNTKETKAFLTHLITSPRCDSVRQSASSTLQRLTGGDSNSYENAQQKNSLTKFAPSKVEEKKNAVRPPLAYQPPTAAKVVATVQPAKVRTYVVQEGDSLWKISRRYKTSVDLIMKQNNLKSDLLKPGTTLKIP